MTTADMTKSAKRRRQRWRAKHPDRPEPKGGQGGAGAQQRRFERRVQERKEKRCEKTAEQCAVKMAVIKAADAASAVSARIAGQAKATSGASAIGADSEAAARCTT